MKKEEKKIEEKTADEEGKEKNEQIEYLRHERGKMAWWDGLDDSNFVKSNFSERCSCVAINGTTTIMLEESLRFSFHTPDHSISLLFSTNPSPTYVALGSQGRYYVKFSRGISKWVGPDTMGKILREGNKNVRTIAFGEEWESFFIVFEDGCWLSNWNIPHGLSNLLRKRNHSTDLRLVSLGPKQEWFLKAADGKVWWGGVSDNFSNNMREIRDSITEMYFGEHESYFVRYN